MRGGARDAFEGKGPQRWPQKRLGRRSEEGTKAVGGGYCRLQMPLKRALAVRGTVAGRWLDALEGGGGGGTSPPSNASLGGAVLCAPSVSVLSTAHVFGWAIGGRTTAVGRVAGGVPDGGCWSAAVTLGVVASAHPMRCI